MLARIPLRIRVTAVFAAVMAVVLAASGVFLYLRLGAELDETIDARLQARAGTATATSDDDFAQVLDAGGRVVEATPGVGDRPLLSAAEVARARRGPLTADRDRVGAEGEPARLLATPAGDRVVVVGAYTDDRRDTLRSLAALLLVGGPVALLLASLAGYGLGRAALRPVESMRRAAAAGERLPVPPSRDEIAALGETLNALLDRLQTALERERTLVSDASHELRTPLAVLKAELELALRRPRSAAELEAALRAAADQTDRLSQLAEDLLVIARSDQGRLPVRPQDVPVRDVFAGVRERFAGRLGDRRLDVGETDLHVEADPLRVEQAVGNLVDNALRHGGSTIELAARQADGHVELHVRDDGDGFPEAFIATAFERFTRADTARTGGGAGLGLAIVDAIARAHGGTAGAANLPGGGADVWLRLPLA